MNHNLPPLVASRQGGMGSRRCNGVKEKAFGKKKKRPGKKIDKEKLQ